MQGRNLEISGDAERILGEGSSMGVSETYERRAACQLDADTEADQYEKCGFSGMQGVSIQIWGAGSRKNKKSCIRILHGMNSLAERV